jgi:hypothetical protein
MSSWLTHGYRPPPKKIPQVNFGFRQLLPEGTIDPRKSGCTVISAFYTIRGKHSLETYKEFIRLFLEGCPCKMVFVTEEALVPFIRECRRAYEDTTDVLIIEKKAWTANKMQPFLWESLLAKDTEATYSSDYYKFLYEKREFVRRVMAYNPFKHNDFMWVDPTICKDPRIIPLIKMFPITNRIVTDKLMIMNQVPFEYSDEKAKMYNGFSLIGVKDRNRINTCIIAGTKEKWIHYTDMYEATVRKYQTANLFWGLDSIITASIALENKSMISLVEPKPTVDSYWKSMYGLLYFGASPTIFKLMTDKATYEKKKSIDELISLK